MSKTKAEKMAAKDPYAPYTFMLRTTAGVAARADALIDLVSNRMTKKAKRADVVREALALGLRALEREAAKDGS